MLTVGVPREVKKMEKRVGLDPAAAAYLCRKGIHVFIESGAGAASGFLDDAYRQAGAAIASGAKELYAKADLILKVKEPQPQEFPLLSSRHILFCFLHLASPESCALVDALIKSGCTAIGFETLEKDGKLPILAPMSEIAGALSAVYAAVIGARAPWIRPSLASELTSAAEVYPNLTGLPPIGRVVIFGGGVAGLSALKTAIQLRGDVSIVERQDERRRELAKITSHVYSPENLPENILQDADVLMGCVHARGERAVKVISADAWKVLGLQKKKIVMDVSIDQGGNFPESRSTSYAEPVYEDSSGHIRFAVPNIPSLSGRAASLALSERVLPYVEKISFDLSNALSQAPELAGAVNIQKGQIRLNAIREVHRR